MIKFELSSKDLNFSKFLAATLSLTASQCFADETGGNSNECDCLILCMDMGQHGEAIFSM